MEEALCLIRDRELHPNPIILDLQLYLKGFHYNYYISASASTVMLVYIFLRISRLMSWCVPVISWQIYDSV